MNEAARIFLGMYLVTAFFLFILLAANGAFEKKDPPLKYHWFIDPNAKKKPNKDEDDELDEDEKWLNETNERIHDEFDPR